MGNLSKEKYKRYILRIKGTPRSVVSYSNTQGDKKFKVKPDLKWNRESSDLRSRLNPTDITTCERK